MKVKWTESTTELLIVLLMIMTFAGCTAVMHVSNNDTEVKKKEIEMKYSQHLK